MIETIANEYEQAPVLGPGAWYAWSLLAEETAALAREIKSRIQVSYTSEAEPYADAHAMLADLAKGHMVVSVANSEHPVWNVHQNADFRLVHDVLGHGTTGTGFDWAGEVAAYESHLEHVKSPLARQALFTEAVGQVAYALHNGGFGPQKCHLLSQWLQWSNLTE